MNDDRRCCNECANLLLSGHCQAAQNRDISASYSYMPIPDLPRRCEAFAPLPDDLDQRAGAERWPGLVLK